MKFIGAHIFDYDATFRGDVTIEGNLTISNSVSQTISFGDNDKLYFGDGNDLEIFSDGNDGFINNNTNHFYITNNANDCDLVLRSDDGSGGVTAYITLDGSATTIVTAVPLHIPEYIVHDGDTNTFFGFEGADQWRVVAGGSEKIHVNTSRIRFNEDVLLLDNHKLNIGSGNDLQLYHDGTDNHIEATSALNIGTANSGVAINIGHTTSETTINDNLTVTGDLTVNGTTTTINSTTLTVDDKNVVLASGAADSAAADGAGITVDGASATILYEHDDTSWNFNKPTNFVGAVTVGVDDTGHDVKFFGATSGIYMMWDESSDRLELTDNAKINFGTGNDLSIYHTGSHSNILANGTGDLIITQGTADQDIILKSDDGSGGVATYIRLDGSQKDVDFSVPVNFGASGGSAGHDVTFFGDTNGYDMFWDTTQNALRLDDGVNIYIGSGNDLKLYHDSNNSYISQEGVGHLFIRNIVDDKDVVFQSDDGAGGVGEYFRLDGSAASSGNYLITLFPDNSRIAMGNGWDMQIWHDGTDNWIYNGTGDLKIEQAANDKDIIFMCDDGSGGSTTYLTLDGSVGYTTVQKDIRFEDNVQLELGTGRNLVIYSDGSNGLISNQVGNLAITNAANDGDIVFNCDDGSGGTETYFYLDGSAGLGGVSANPVTIWPDNSGIAIGTGQDLLLYHNGSHTYVMSQGTGDFNIVQHVDDKDIVFQCDDGSGGVATYFYLDGSVGFNRFPYPVIVEDSVNFNLGTGQDMQLLHNGSDSKIDNNTGDLYITNNTNDKDIILRSDDGSGGVTEYFRVDGSSVQTIVTKNFRYLDNAQAMFGTSEDLAIYHDATNSYVNNATGDLYIKNTADDKDIIFQSDDQSGGVETYFFLDGSNGRNRFSKTIAIPDSVQILMGNGDDLQLQHDGSNSYINNNTGDLYIKNLADDKDIIFQSDDGGGGVETYFFLDGSLSGGNPYTVFPDDAILTFGNSQDLQIKHSSSYSYIDNTAGGDLVIRQFVNDKDIIFQSDDGAGGNATYFYLDGSSATHDGSATTALYTNWPDKSLISMGTGHDLQFKHDGTNSHLYNATGDLYITNAADDKDIIFQSDDGSGGTTAYITLDGSTAMTTMHRKVNFNDNGIFANNTELRWKDSGGTERTILELTNADDLYLGGSFSGSMIFVGGGSYTERMRIDDSGGVLLSSTLTVGVDDTGYDVKFFGATSGKYLLWDESDNALEFTDSTYLYLGSSADLKLYHDGSSSYIENGTGNLNIMSRGDDADMVFWCDDGSGGDAAYITLDGSATTTIFSKQATFNNTVVMGSQLLKFADNGKANFGDSNDLQIYHDGSHNYIDAVTGDQDIIFKGTDSSSDITALTLDMSDAGTAIFNHDIKIADDGIIKVGNDTDLYITHDATNSHIVNATGDLKITQNANDKDIIFNCDNGSGGNTAYLTLDGSTVTTVFSKQTRHEDAVLLQVGSGNDAAFYHNGTDTYLINDTGNLRFRQFANDADVMFENDDGSGGITEYFRLDGGLGYTVVSKLVNFSDNVSASWGAAGDLSIRHDGTDNLIAGSNGHIYITNSADDKDIILRSDDGSGGVETYFFLDGSTSSTVVPDSKYLYFGSGHDMRLYFDGTDGYVQSIAGDMIIRQSADDKDILFQCDDGSGGITAYITLDGSATAITAHKNITSTGGDSVAPQFNLLHDGTNPSTNEELGVIQFQVDYDGSHQDWGKIRLDTNASAVRTNMEFYVKSASGAEQVALTLQGQASDVPNAAFAGSLDLVDGKVLKLGNSDDLQIFHDATDTNINNYTGDLYIRNYADDKDIIFQSDDGSGGVTAYLTIDGGVGYTLADKHIRFADDIEARFGAGSDLRIYHDGNNNFVDGYGGHVYIRNTVDNHDIVFQTDDGSGGITAYITLDGSAGLTTVQKNIKFEDSVHARFGNGSDLRIFHDGSNSEMNNHTGHLSYINYADDKDIIFKTDDGSGGTTAYITLDGGANEIHIHKTMGVGTTSPDTAYKIDIAGKAQVQSVLELDDLLTLNAISTPSDPAAGKSSIYMDSADGAIKVKINVGGTVVTRTLASYEG